MAQLLMLLGRWQVMESLGEQSSEACIRKLGEIATALSFEVVV